MLTLIDALAVDPQVVDAEVQTPLQAQGQLLGAERQEVGGQGDRGLVHRMVQHPRLPTEKGAASVAGAEHRGAGHRGQGGRRKAGQRALSDVGGGWDCRRGTQSPGVGVLGRGGDKCGAAECEEKPIEEERLM